MLFSSIMCKNKLSNPGKNLYIWRNTEIFSNFLFTVITHECLKNRNVCLVNFGSDEIQNSGTEGGHRSDLCLQCDACNKYGEMLSLPPFELSLTGGLDEAV